MRDDEKTTHYTNLGVQIQPSVADAMGYVHYRERYAELPEAERTPAERWLAVQEARIAAWRKGGG